MEVREQRSRFFHKELRADRKKTSDSAYFTRSPSSAYGAVHSLGPWLQCLANHHGGNIVCSKSPSDTGYCEACRPVIQAAVQQFRTCPHFIKGWKDSSAAKNEESSLACWKCAEALLHQCVRHLCSQRCYMRAYSPCREWFTLRKRLREETSVSVDTVLSGWSCVLLPVTNDFLPRVAFSDPDGKLYYSQSQALRHLEIESSRSPSYFPLIRSSKAKNPDGIGAMSPVALSFYSQTVPGKRKRKPNTKCISTDSPFGLLEELFVDDPWKLLISTIFLNRTTRVQVDSILYVFLQHWPSPDKVITNATTADIASLIQPMGIAQKRAAGIIRFSKDYLALLSRKKAAVRDENGENNIALRCFSRDDILSLHNCNDYAAAAYKLFIQKDHWSEEPCDHALRAYAAYQRSVTT